MSEKQTIHQAYTKAWAQLSNPKHNKNVKVKTKSGGTYTFDYTDLGGIFDAAKTVFTDHELSIQQDAYNKIVDGQLYVLVETTIIHSSGETLKSKPLIQKATGNIQDMGGLITYLKRYSVSAMLGIATEEDDDANGAIGNEVSKNKPQPKKTDETTEKLTTRFSEAYQITGKANIVYEKLGKSKDELSKLIQSNRKKDKEDVIKQLEGIINDYQQAG